MHYIQLSTLISLCQLNGIADDVTKSLRFLIILGMCFTYTVKSVQSSLSDLLTTSATHGTFSRPSTKRGLISIIKLMQFTIVRFF